MLPKTEKEIRNKIDSYKKALEAEKRKFGDYDDGYGRRYLLFYLYYSLNDDAETGKDLLWYNKNFDDDTGEPYQILCWALILNRMGKVNEAKIKLAEHYKSNFYVIPKIIGESFSRYNHWHSSNYQYPEYAEVIPEEISSNISSEEIEWLKHEYSNDQFNELRNRYIDLYIKMKEEKDKDKRWEIIMEANKLIDEIFGRSMNEKS